MNTRRLVRKLPDGVCAVYYLYRRGVLEYIGSSRDLRSRIIRHQHKSFTHFEYRIVSEGYRLRLEKNEIAKYKPILNGVLCRNLNRLVIPLSQEEMELVTKKAIALGFKNANQWAYWVLHKEFVALVAA